MGELRYPIQFLKSYSLTVCSKHLVAHLSQTPFFSKPLYEKHSMTSVDESKLLS